MSKPIYFLRNKKTGELAHMSVSSNGDGDFCNDVSVTIGYGEVLFSTTDPKIATKVLSTSSDWFNSNFDSPEWDTKTFGNDHEVVTLDTDTFVTTNIGPHKRLVDILTPKEMPVTHYPFDLKDSVIEQIDIDHTLTDGVDFPDRISYKYFGYMIAAPFDKLENVVGEFIYLDNTLMSLVYVHAVIDAQTANKLITGINHKDDYNVMILSNVV